MDTNGPTWMIDGKPGQILALLVAAVKDAKPIEKKHDKKAGMSYLNVDDIKSVAKAALSAHGIVTKWETLGNPLIDTGKAPFTVVEVRCTFIAPDGSYVQSTIQGGGQAGMGRSLTVATTAAVKQILGLTLQLATGDDEPRDSSEDREAWSENLQRVVAEFNAAQSFEDIKAVGALPQAKALTQSELPIAHHYAKMRRQELTLLGPSGGFDPDDYKPKKVR